MHMTPELVHVHAYWRNCIWSVAWWHQYTPHKRVRHVPACSGPLTMCSPAWGCRHPLWKGPWMWVVCVCVYVCVCLCVCVCVRCGVVVCVYASMTCICLDVNEDCLELPLGLKIGESWQLILRTEPRSDTRCSYDKALLSTHVWLNYGRRSRALNPLPVQVAMTCACGCSDLRSWQLWSKHIYSPTWNCRRDYCTMIKVARNSIVQAMPTMNSYGLTK